MLSEKEILEIQKNNIVKIRKNNLEISKNDNLSNKNIPRKLPNIIERSSEELSPYNSIINTSTSGSNV